MKVLVTGGCGFIASHVTDMLVENGHNVAIVDNLSTGTLANKNERASFYKVDICSPDLADLQRTTSGSLEASTASTSRFSGTATSSDLARSPTAEAGVVAVFTELLMEGKLPTLNHFREEPDGMIRDYCYVKDIARANLIAATQATEGIFNIGTGQATCTLDLYRLIVHSLREKGIVLLPAFDEPKRAAARDGDIRVSRLNAGRAERELGFKPRYDLREGLAETIDWYLTEAAMSGQSRATSEKTGTFLFRPYSLLIAHCFRLSSP